MKSETANQIKDGATARLDISNASIATLQALLAVAELSKRVSNSRCFRNDISGEQVDLIAAWREALEAAQRATAQFLQEKARAN